MAKRSEDEIRFGLTFWAGLFVGVLTLGVLLLVTQPILASTIGRWFMTEDEAPSAVIRNYGVVIAAVGAGVIAIWRAIVADRDNKIAASAHLREMRRLDAESFQRGAVGLGDDSPTVKTAAILTLQDLSVRPGSYSFRTVELLQAFARENESGGEASLVPEYKAQSVRTLIDIAGRVDVLGAVDLSAINLRGASIHKVDFSTITMFEADLRLVKGFGAVFNECFLLQADFRKAALQGAHFKKSDLRGSDFRQANLREAVFDGAELSNVIFCDANLRYATFHDAQTAGVDVSNADLRHAAGLQGHTGLFAWADKRPMVDESARSAIMLLDPRTPGARGTIAFLTNVGWTEGMSWEDAENAFPKLTAPG